MAISELPDCKTFFVGRTPPMKRPQRDWLQAAVQRVRDANGRTVRAYHWGWDTNWDKVSFWLLPAASLAMWMPAIPYTVSAAHGSKVEGAKLDDARLDGAFELVRKVPVAIAFARMEVRGFLDKPRRSTPHVEVELLRFRDGRAWTVQARFDDSHPGLRAGGSPAEITASARERLDPVDTVDSAGNALYPLSPARSGLTDAEEAYRVFRSVVEAAIPRPTEWRVAFDFDAYRWAEWTSSLNTYDLAWCYGGHLHAPHGFDPYKRPSLIHPSHPLRIPIAAWKPGSPPRLQMSIVHAAEGSWLEFETAKGRERLDELSLLVGRLEVWEGRPELRWTS